MKFDLVLFDLGGTLISYENSSWDELGMNGCAKASAYLHKETGIKIEPELLWRKLYKIIENMVSAPTENLIEINLEKIVAEIIGKFGVNNTDGLPAKFIYEYYQPVTEQVTLISGAAEILTKIKSNGMKIGLVSNTVFPRDFHLAEMKRFGIFEFFDFTLFSSDLKIRKPNKEVYLMALDIGGAEPEKSIFIGDRLIEDVGGPQSVGIKGILKFHEKRDYSAAIDPYKNINELSELENILF